MYVLNKQQWALQLREYIIFLTTRKLFPSRAPYVLHTNVVVVMVVVYGNYRLTKTSDQQTRRPDTLESLALGSTRHQGLIFCLDEYCVPFIER